MAEAKENRAGGDDLLASEENQASINANDGGGFRDDIDAGETINGDTLPVPSLIATGDVIDIDDVSQVKDGDANRRVFTNNFLAQTFQIEKTNTDNIVATIKKIKLSLQKTGTVSGNLEVHLYAVDGSDKPTGSSLASDSILASSITSSAVWYDFTFDYDFSLNTTYAIVLKGVIGIDASNSIYNNGSASSQYANGDREYSTDGGSSWTIETTKDLAFEIESEYVMGVESRIYACDADHIDKLQFAGFATSNSTIGNPIDFQGGGVIRGFTGLLEGRKYYVQDDKTIGLTPGTYEILAGIAISATELLITKEQGLAVIPTNNLKVSADTERTLAGSGSSAFILKKEIMVVRSGTYRVKFDAKELPSEATGEVSIYVNGVEVYNVDPVTTSYVTYAQNIQLGAGDLVQIYLSEGGTGWTMYVKNFRLYFDVVNSDGIVNTD